MSATCGTAEGYVQGCRCEPCRLAKREVARAYRERKRTGTPFVRTPTVRTIPHGTRTGYVYGCRCGECRAAQAAYTRKRREATEAQRANPAEPVKPGPKPQPKFPNHLNNLRHAMTIEEWQAREAADPECRPVTQAPIQVRAERLPDLGDGLTVVDRIIAEALRD